MNLSEQSLSTLRALKAACPPLPMFEERIKEIDREIERKEAMARFKAAAEIAMERAMALQN